MEVAHMLKITKFGGSSVANAEQFKKIKNTQSNKQPPSCANHPRHMQASIQLKTALQATTPITNPQTQPHP